MKDFGTALKRALDANGRLPSELAKAAGVTGNAVARWLKCIPFQRIKIPSQIQLFARGFFVCYRLATVVYARPTLIVFGKLQGAIIVYSHQFFPATSITRNP